MSALILAIGIFSYAVQGYGLWTMAKRRGLERAWLAWVPIANTWLMGRLSDQYRELTTGEDPKQRNWLVIQKILWHISKIAAIGFFALSYFGSGLLVVLCELVLDLDSKPVVMPIMIVLGIVLLFMVAVSALLAVLYLIRQYKALFYLYRSSDPKTSTLFFVISLVCFFTMTVFVFLNRNKDLGMPPKPEEFSSNSL